MKRIRERAKFFVHVRLVRTVFFLFFGLEVSLYFSTVRVVLITV